jgi:hypothetical protein
MITSETLSTFGDILTPDLEKTETIDEGVTVILATRK